MMKEHIMVISFYIGVIMMAVTVLILTYYYFFKSNTAKNKAAVKAENKNIKRSVIAPADLKSGQEEQNTITAVDSIKVNNSIHDMPHSDTVEAKEETDTEEKKPTVKTANVLPYNITNKTMKNNKVIDNDEIKTLNTTISEVNDKTGKNQKETAVDIIAINETKNNLVSSEIIKSDEIDISHDNTNIKLSEQNSNPGVSIIQSEIISKKLDQVNSNDQEPTMGNNKLNQMLKDTLKQSDVMTELVKPINLPMTEGESNNGPKQKSSLGDLSAMFSKEIEDTSEANELAKDMSDVEITSLTSVGEELLSLLRQERS